MAMRKDRWMKYGKMIVLMLLALVSLEFVERSSWRPDSVVDSSQEALFSAWREKQSGVWMTVNASVEKTLRDDNEGSRHQRFLLRAGDGLTVLVAHNIDLASRVPLFSGDDVELRGRYEWNEKGGVLHWTHRDPSGRKDGGWIRYAGKVYR